MLACGGRGGCFPHKTNTLVCSARGRCVLVVCLLWGAVLGSALELSPTRCEACLTVVEEYFQRWTEAKHEHDAHSLSQDRWGAGGTDEQGPRTWWSRTDVEPVQSDVSFEKRLHSTCDATRLSVYKPIVRDVCHEIVTHPTTSTSRKLVHLYSTGNATGFNETANLTPGGLMHIWRVPGMKWHVCSQMHSFCSPAEVQAKTRLTDRCGMCHSLAKDLLYLVRRGEPGADKHMFYSSMMADLCLSIELRHPRGQHNRILDVCQMVEKHEDSIVELLKEFEADPSSTTADFLEVACGEDTVGLCR